ncbi:MAG: CRTAC1 family protein [Planctomycetes bacterium]|nr:CRTAC1 family protein [Planctomycetota bacterium]
MISRLTSNSRYGDESSPPFRPKKGFRRKTTLLCVFGLAALAVGVGWFGISHRQRGRAVSCPAEEPLGQTPERRDSGRSAAPVPVPAHPGRPIVLADVTGESGIRFVHTDGSSGRRYILESMTAGVATFDFDGDGLIDIYFPNGAPLPGARVQTPPHHALYRNLGNWKFQDVTREAGVAITAFGLGIAVADYDNDGWPDVYLNNFGPNILLHNNGDGTFSAIPEACDERQDIVGAGAAFLDVDRDGHLDVYAGNYIAWSADVHVPLVVGGIPSYPSPRDYAPVPDNLYRNNADGSFTDISQSSGIALHAGRSMGMTCVDFDNDGDTDIFVCNDVQENFLFQNDGRGNFQEVAVLAGTAYSGNGEVLANMAVEAGDYNNDGWLDFYTTNYQGELPVLFHNLGGGTFDDATRRTNAADGCFNNVNWGCALVDLDNDGRRDLFVGNGHTEDNIELRMSNTSYRAQCVVLQNTGGRFVNVSGHSPGLQRKLVARGLAADDLDNDGDLDVVVLGSREGPLILRNMLRETGPDNHWLRLRLIGTTGNRSGVGTRVTVVAGDLRQIDEVRSGRSYQSCWGSQLHFGLGPHNHVDRIEIQWCGGGVEVIESVAADQQITVVEGRTASP